MALVLADRVNETTTTAGTGTLTLAGAVTGYQSFSVVGNGNTTYYTIVGQTTGEWEVGIGTYTSSGTTLSRDTVLASSAGGTTKVTLSAGTKFVFCDYPAGRAVYLDTASNATIPGITLSGGTANGVAYLDGSKVLTTGTALTFNGTTFTSTGSQGLLNTVGGNTARMVATAAGAYFGSTTAADVIFQYNSAEGMRLTSTGLGIGTSSPAYKLDVNGLIVTRGSSSGLAVTRRDTDALSWQWYSSAGNLQAYSQVLGGDVMTMTAAGNVGLGVTPSAWTTYPALQVNKGSLWGPGSSLYISANLYFDGTNRRYIASSYANEYEQAGGQHIWYNAPSGTAGNVVTLTQAMTLDNSGNLGIGTTSPSNPLTVTSDTSAQVRIGTVSANINARLTLAATGTGLNVLGTTGVGPLAFYSGATEQARFDTSGNFGIGTSNPLSKLNVYGSTGLILNLADNTWKTTAIIPVDEGSNFKGALAFYTNTGGTATNITEKMRLDSLGNLGIGVTPSAWNSAVKAIQISPSAAFWSVTNTQARIGNNHFYDSVGNFKYISTLPASDYQQFQGIHSWFVAPSGTAGNTITFTQAMTLTNGGYLGIGTTSPNYSLVVSNAGAAGVEISPTGGINSGGFIQSYNRSTSAYFAHTNYATSWYWNNGGTSFMTLDSSGNLGIGTTTPSTKLDVRGTVNSSDGTNGNVRMYVDASYGFFQSLNQAANAYRPMQLMGSTISFANNGTINAILDTSGNLGIGVTPSAWISYQKGVDFGGAGNYGAINARADFVTFSNNLYLNASNNWTYKNTGAAQDFYMSGGAFVWRSVGSGTAGTTAALTQPMTLDASGNLLVGGTTQYGAAKITLTGNGGYLALNTTTSGYTLIRGFDSGVERWSIGQIGFGGADGMAFYTGSGNTERMRLNSSGNLGIGTSSPTAGFRVQAVSAGGSNVIASTSSDSSGVTLYMQANGSTAGVFGTSTNHAVTFVTNNTEKMRLDSSGNLGIGVTPSASGYKTVELTGIAITGINATDGRIYGNAYEPGSGAVYKTSSLATLYRFNAGSHIWYTAPSGTAGNAITFTQAMTLDASGNLLVGTTSSYGGPGRINVGFNQSSNFGITLRNTSATATGVFVSFENSGGTGNGSISQTNSTTVAYNTSSDRRLKKDIAPAPQAGTDIDAIEIVSHGWASNDDLVKYGVVAQDLATVASFAVTKGDDGDEIECVWGVDYSKLVPMLVKEIQSLRVRLNALENK